MVAKPQEYAPYFWMRDSGDPKVQFLWERMQVSTRPDPSDAGMAYFLATGDVECDPAKLKRLIQDKQPPQPAAARSQVRLEAENFRSLEGYDVEDTNDRNASHRLQVKSTTAKARIHTPFADLFTPHGRYDVQVRYSVAGGADVRFTFLVNGVAKGEPWSASASPEGWQTRTMHGVDIKSGDAIEVTAKGGTSRIDYVQLAATSPTE